MNIIHSILRAVTTFFLLLSIPTITHGLEQAEGEVLFQNNCAGCHINGGNIIRRGKTLKIKDLKKRGLDNPEAIAKIARDGIGIMSGYKEVLGKNGDQLVAIWIWSQAQNAWIQG